MFLTVICGWKYGHFRVGIIDSRLHGREDGAQLKSNFLYPLRLSCFARDFSDFPAFFFPMYRGSTGYG